MNIEVIDKVIPLELLVKYNDLDFAVTRNRTDDGENFYSTCVEYGSDYGTHNQSISLEFKNKEAKDIWKWFKS